VKYFLDNFVCNYLTEESKAVKFVSMVIKSSSIGERTLQNDRIVLEI